MRGSLRRDWSDPALGNFNAPLENSAGVQHNELVMIGRASVAAADAVPNFFPNERAG
jgi:hypothetical protein